MPTPEQIKQDLDYIANAVRREDAPPGVPAIYFLWALIVPLGFALPDFAPQWAGAFWFVGGIGGGLLSWWLGDRHSRRHGINDRALGRRYGLHWCVAGLGFVLCILPAVAGRVPVEAAVANYLLVGGLVYALAGVHLERPLLWSGLAMLAAYVVLIVFAPPYVWTFSGLAISASLAWAGISCLRQQSARG